MSSSYLAQLMSDTFDVAHADEGGMQRLPALVSVLIAQFEEAGVLSSPSISYARETVGKQIAEVHAYDCDAEEDLVTLIYCIDATEGTPLGTTPEVSSTGKEEIERAFRRLATFYVLAKQGKLKTIDSETPPLPELINLLKSADDEGLRIEFLVVTTGKVSERAVRSGEKHQIDRDLWDLVRLDRVMGSSGNGSIDIDLLNEYGVSLPVLMTDKAPDGVQVLLTWLPGKVLADIYNTHRSALLERNVRSFLQFNGKVNKGIRTTLLQSPGRFLAYNNGLSATASDIELSDVRSGVGRIRSLKGFQIVNGGQTTASIAAVARRDKTDLSGVSVQMKLTIVPEKLLDSLVPDISKYANTQNKIQEADFHANDPWHVGIERLSRAEWTAARDGAPKGTRWFYERSRGQYADALAGEATAAGKRRFRQENPPSQKFTKTDLAKYLMSWDQRPALVSKGAQKCFIGFMSQMASTARQTPTQGEFRRIVSLAILFKAAEDLYGEMGFQGFRAQVVTYAVAYLSHFVGKQLDVEEFWKRQAAPAKVVAALKLIIPGIRDVVVNPPASQRNTTEWAKKDALWTAVLEREIDVRLPKASPSEAGPATAQGTVEEGALIAAVGNVPGTTWLSLAAWAKETSSLQVWQRKISFSVGKQLERGKMASIKQSVQGAKLLLEAVRLGFKDPQLSAGSRDEIAKCLATCKVGK
jgi:hypothetical protein